MRELDAYAAERHVELIPTLQSFGHMGHILKHAGYAELDESDLGWTLSPAEPGTYQLLRDLYDEYLPNFRSPLFNANCDEPWDLCTGKSKQRGEQVGRGGVFLDHVRRVRDLAAEHGKRTMIWGDVVHSHPEIIPEIDRDLILLDWWYEAEFDYDRVEAFRRNGIDFLVCPGTSTWNCLFPRMENSILNIARWADAARRHGALGVICTDWGDYGHYNLQGDSWLAFAWTAQQAWSGETDARSFDRAFGRLLFGETRGAAAGCYRALGAVHDAGFPVFNGSALQFLFFDDLDRAFFLQQAKPAALRRSLRRLERCKARLRDAADAFARDPLTHDELIYATEASLFAVRKALAAGEWLAWRKRPDRLDARGQAAPGPIPRAAGRGAGGSRKEARAALAGAEPALEPRDHRRRLGAHSRAFGGRRGHCGETRRPRRRRTTPRSESAPSTWSFASSPRGAPEVRQRRSSISTRRAIPARYTEPAAQSRSSGASPSRAARTASCGSGTTRGVSSAATLRTAAAISSGCERANRLRARDGELIGEGNQAATDRRQILAGGDGEHQVAATPRDAGQGARQRRRRGGRVRRVHDQPGAVGEELDPRGKRGGGEGTPGGGGERPVGNRPETPHAGESQRGVPRLVGAGDGEPGLEDEGAIPKADPLAVEILVQDLGGELAPVSGQGTAELPGALLHHRRRLGRQGAHDQGNAGLGDAGLLAGDLRQARAQLLGVFELDARHAGHRGSHDVRRVQPPAQAHLQHRVVDPGLAKRASAAAVVASKKLGASRAAPLGARRPRAAAAPRPRRASPPPPPLRRSEIARSTTPGEAR